MMQECANMNRILLVAFLCCAFSAMSGPAVADSIDLPPTSAVLSNAATEIAATAKELAEHKWPEAKSWDGAEAGEAVIVWSYAESVNALRPAYWLVEVRNGKALVGLLGLSPQEGAFVWRSTRLSKAQGKLAGRLLSSKPEAMSAALKAGPYDAKSLDFDRTVLASVNGSFYWVAPTKGENLVASLALPASGEAKAGELWEALSRGRSAHPGRLVPESSGPVFQLARDGLGGATANIQMVGIVPLLADLGSAAGWAHALSMVRQWWSPMTIGSREDLRAKWQNAAGIAAGQGASLQAIYRLTANGPGAKAGYAYEPLRTLWYGPGTALSKAEDVGSDSANDVREWILRETPVIAAIDADGMGKTEGADQYVLITGYSQDHRRIYVNNPVGLPDTFAYEAFDVDYWGAWYTEQCNLPTLCETPHHFRRGLVAGAPGDFIGPPMPRPGLSVPAVGTDSQVVTVANISLSIEGPKAPAFAGKDRFQQSYQTECRVDAPGGRFHGGGGKGSWTDLRDTRGNERVVVTAVYGKMLFPGQFVGGGRFDLNFPDGEPGNTIVVTTTCTVHDADDRAHFLHKRTVTVFDDSKEDGGKKVMPLPLLRPAVATATSSLTLRDDDPTPPEISLLSPSIIWDSEKGAHRFEVRLDDASPIAAAQVAYAFEDKEPKSYGSFEGNEKGRYWKSIPRDKLLEHVGKSVYFWVKAQDDDNDRKNDGALAVKKFTIPIQDDDPSGPVVVQYVARRAENMQFQVYVHLEDASGVYVDHAWPKLYYSFKGNVSSESFDGIAKLVAAPKVGPGWFTAVAPWGEQGALAWAADKEKKEDTFIFLKVRSYDLDKDRKNDDAETWSQSWSEVYLPAPLTDTTTIVDIWPAGDRETGVNSLWDDWFDPPPKHVPFNIFFEGRPAQVSPPPVPEVLTGQNARIRIHIAVSLAFVHSGAHLAITGASLSLAPYKLNAAIVSKKGIYELGSMTFPSEEKEGAVEVKLEIPSGALSTGENILVLKPVDATGEYDQISLQRIHLEANELPKPPKIEGIGIE
jgi:hypothetical protein